MMEDTKDKPTITSLSNQPINPEDKWILGINLLISTPAKVIQFIQWKSKTYKKFGWKGDKLGELYEMDFDQFRADDFGRCKYNTQVLLCNVL